MDVQTGVKDSATSFVIGSLILLNNGIEIPGPWGGKTT